MKNLKRRRLEFSLATLIGVVGIFLTIASTSPHTLNANLNEYLRSVGGTRFVGGILIGLVLGAIIGYFAFVRSTGPLVLDDKEYRDAFRKLIASGEIKEVRIFGYTGETVLSDLLSYKDRYRDLRVRMLHRNWVVEKSDQERHNSRPETSDSRLWDKAAAIRKTGTEPWTHTMRRELRYYDGPPQIKGVILSDDRAPRVAFLSFFKWDDVPGDGGSPFKGVPKGIIELDRDSPGASELMEYAVSQFELMWRHAKSVSEVLANESAGAPGKTTAGNA